MRKILAVTGIRSEYDILYPVIDELRNRKNFNIGIVVCGAHLSDWHGFTLKRIEKNGFDIVDKIDYLFMTNRKTQRVKGIGVLTYALSQTVERENPDFLIVVGDREESIATSLIGNYMNVLTAHLGGGDPVYGNADDPIRHAVSKLAHIHFTTTKLYADYLKRMGEEEWRIFNIGNPSLDNIRKEPYKSLEEISDFLQFNISDKDYIALIKHPLSSEIEDSYFQMKVTLEALEEIGREYKLKIVGIYPNTDPGSYDILKAIDEYKNSRYIKFYKTLPREIFINIFRNALCLVGNSSMGILEAPFYKLPVVNIGNRQKGRLNAGNVEFVSHEKNYIEKAVIKACYDKNYRKYITSLKNPYGDGFASKKIGDILENINLKDKKWWIKKLNYIGE